MQLSSTTTRVRTAEQPPAVVTATENRAVGDYLQVIRGVELGPNLRTLTAKARREVLVLRADRRVSAAWESMDLFNAARGVTVRILRPRTVAGTDSVTGTAAGVQVRELTKPGTAFLVVDRELAALSIEPVDTAGPQLVTRAPGIVAALVAAFERHWSTALPTVSGGGLPDGAEVDILSCMADGMTDESIARHLGVCTRTVGRAIGRMMESLGARNRFELGVRALRAGWFD